MGLEEILKLCGAKKPFAKDGELTSQGIRACERLGMIVDGLEQIGAKGKTGDALQNYIDEIIRLGF